MKVPVVPPKFSEIMQALFKGNGDVAFRIITEVGLLDEKARYLHWDKVKHLEPPEGLSNEQWWTGMKMARSKTRQFVPFTDKDGIRFSFCLPSIVGRELHWLDQHAAGTISADKPLAGEIRPAYLLKSFVEEAISSSQLEGAATTRKVAREMIRQKRKPKDKSEQMIFNNYHAMRFIKDNCEERLTPAMIFELHKILTEDTLDDPDKAGVFRTTGDEVYVVDEHNEVIHTPPPAAELADRLEMLCIFANGDLVEDDFLHPVIKAITLHFMLAYDHPFVDGNGRTARALFYWYMANQKYWLLEYIAISKIIKQAPAQYTRAYLYTETDDGDLTYFIIHQLDVIRKAIGELQTHLEIKIKAINYAENLVEHNKKLKGRLNRRQLSLLQHGLKNPRFVYKINEHQNSHEISYETARQDLTQMADKMNLLTKARAGKSFIFIAPSDLEERIKAQ